MKSVLVTGGAGFIGHHLIEHLIEKTDWNIHLISTFNHRGNSSRLSHLEQHRFTVHVHDLRHQIPSTLIDRIGPVDHIYHLAAESHVERSLSDPVPFIRNNVDVTLSVMEYARKIKPKSVFQISTDEVYGPAEKDHKHKEWEPAIPSNPYAASKAAQEAIAISYWRAYGVPVVITNTMNNFGERQDIEKFVPMVIQKVLAGEEVIIHGSPGDIGSRYYLHARNHADALLFLSDTDYIKPNMMPIIPSMFPTEDRPDRYHVVGDEEVDNLEMAELIAEFAGKPLKYRLEEFHKTRPGHDRRYALDGSKLAEIGWKHPVQFRESLERTVKWTMRHPEWLVQQKAKNDLFWHPV
jgi:dTDP-glucose 4,6-dehydratase